MVTKIVPVLANQWGVARVEILDKHNIVLRNYAPPPHDIPCRLSAVPRWFRSRIEELIASDGITHHGIKIGNALYINIK